MMRVCAHVLVLSFLIVFNNCSDSDADVPNGVCRLTSVVYDNGLKFLFKYDQNGRLIQYNMPQVGPTCKGILEYNDAGRLSRRTELCAGKIDLEINYQYESPTVLKGQYRNHMKQESATMMLYYNESVPGQLDSMVWSSKDSRHVSKYSYSGGNLISSEEADDPCCWTFVMAEATYDDKINPWYVLKQSWGSLGMESIFDSFFPSGMSIETPNNRINYRRIWYVKPSTEAPIIEERNTFYETSLQYYADSPYLQHITTTSSSTTSSPNGMSFNYGACQ